MKSNGLATLSKLKRKNNQQAPYTMTITILNRAILNVLVICSLLLIYGCGGILVAGATAGAVAVQNDSRPTQTIVDDQVIEMAAIDKIYSDPQLTKNVHINVTSYNHIVLLTGETLTKEQRNRVINIVRNISNVRRVHNELRVTDLATFNARSSDSWISSKVKTQMLATENFDASYIKVVTEGSTVYLLGLVTQEQGTQAAEIARHIEGVQRVVKLFEYVEPSQPSDQTSNQIQTNSN